MGRKAGMKGRRWKEGGDERKEWEGGRMKGRSGKKGLDKRKMGEGDRDELVGERWKVKWRKEEEGEV